MRLTDIAFGNLKVRAGRTVFLILGIGLGVATAVALATLTGALRGQLRTDLENAGVRVAVAPYAERLSLAYRGVTVASALSFETRELPPATLDRIGRVAAGSRITVVAPKLISTLPAGARRLPVVGVDFRAEARLNRHWEVNGRMPAGPRELLLGYRVARRLTARPGAVLTLAGARFTVVGVLADTGAQEDLAVFLSLKELSALLRKPGALNLVELAVARERADQVIEDLQKALPGAKVVAVKGAEEARREVVDRFARVSTLIILMVVVCAALIVGTVMMASVNERTREIGIFRAIGYRQVHIQRIILTEAAVVSATGGALGYLAGMSTATAAGPLVAGMAVKISWNPLGAVAAVGCSLLIGLGAGLYPARKAARLDPATALRFV